MKRTTIRIIAVTIAVVLGMTACTVNDDWTETVTSDNAGNPVGDSRAEKDARRLIYTQGVGYSYNGLYGKECNVGDVRSQVIDLDSLMVYDTDNLYHEISMPTTTSGYTEGYSLTEYLQNLYVKAQAEASLCIIFNGDIQACFNIWQHTRKNSYFCRSYARKGVMTKLLDARSLSAAVKRRDYGPKLLTRNFREALDHLKEQLANPSNDRRRIAIDSLIMRYGTHVVTSATLGGSVEIEMSIETDTLHTLYQKELMGGLSLAMYEHRAWTENEQRELQVLNSADCRLTVRGGDANLLDKNLINFKWGENRLRDSDIDPWIASINDSTAALVYMKMIPIWDIIPDRELADMVEAHVTGDAELLLSLYGYQNFVSTKFTLTPPDNKAECFNIVCANRYVATVCHEQIDAISPTEKVWVAYPIYGQQINTASGLCIHKGRAWRVVWLYGGMSVEEISTEDDPDGTVYMNAGVLEPDSVSAYTYLQSKPVTAYEWPYAITTDGRIDRSKPWYYTRKEGYDFLLYDRSGLEQSGSLDGLPNWYYEKARNRVVRSSNYFYYYNPIEVNNLY
ncbi:MAG: hypothetical protein K6B45_09065 [Bacteroidaceae bacterium]|nr:hypothetical protein [Bacteroidaceae bacterium]